MLQAAEADFAECRAPRRRQAHEAVSGRRRSGPGGQTGPRTALAELSSERPSKRWSFAGGGGAAAGAARAGSRPGTNFSKDEAERIGQDVKYTEHDYRSRLLELAERGEGLHRKLKSSEESLHQREGQAAQGAGRVAADQADKSLLAAATEAFQLASAQVDLEEITLVDQRLGELDHFKHFVNSRYEMMNRSATAGDLADWRTQLGELIERLEATRSTPSRLRLDEIHVDRGRALRAVRRRTHPRPALEALHQPGVRAIAATGRDVRVEPDALKARRRTLGRFYAELETATHVKAGSNPLGASASRPPDSGTTSWPVWARAPTKRRSRSAKSSAAFLSCSPA